MADEGDGLTVLKEYRGYIVDYGVEMNGKSHKRLSLARKELLVESREEKNMAAGQGPESNKAVLAAFDVTKALEATRDFYLHKDMGAEIDLYWVELELKVPVVAFPAVPANGPHPEALARDNAYRWSGKVQMPNFSPTTPLAPSYDGAGLVYRDAQLVAGDGNKHTEIYGFGSQDRPKLYELNRDKNLVDFVKLYLPSRLGPVVRRLTYPAGRLETSNHSSATSTGASIQLASVADERKFSYHLAEHFTAAEFVKLLDFIVAHEIGHLPTPDLGPASGGHEDPGVGMLMGVDSAAFKDGNPIDLQQLTWGRGESVQKVDLKRRKSIGP